MGYWQKKEGRRAYHHTAPISSCYALYEGIRLILEEGLSKVQQRHRDASSVLKNALELRGFVYAVKNPEVYIFLLFFYYFFVIFLLFFSIFIIYFYFFCFFLLFFYFYLLFY